MTPATDANLSAAAEAQSPGASSRGFFQTGGALLHTDPSYIERRADSELLQAMISGEFCYVLTSRQMGKSSLMVRTANELRRQDIKVAILDLTAFGQNLTPDQWYDGMCERLGRLFELELEIEGCWEANLHASALQRFMRVIDVVLNLLTSPVCIFIDEIDFARSLNFSTDEFFSAIRECFNRRTEDPAMRRLTFCLLGVASPSDLIRDQRTTPFNIGRRIELTDFTLKDAAPLAAGLRQPQDVAQRILERIMYWTGGHPYLTQKLCRAMQDSDKPGTPAKVDRLCAELFLSSRARNADDNLIFVRERLLRSGTDIPALLTVYGQICSWWRHVHFDETDPVIMTLRLSGIVTVNDKGHLKVRNRIYGRVYNRDWIRANMPDQEARRQRAAYRRGLLIAGGSASVVCALLAGLWLYTLKLKANEQAAKDQTQRQAGAIVNYFCKSFVDLLEQKGKGASITDAASKMVESAESLDAPPAVRVQTFVSVGRTFTAMKLGEPAVKILSLAREESKQIASASDVDNAKICWRLAEAYQLRDGAASSDVIKAYYHQSLALFASAHASSTADALLANFSYKDFLAGDNGSSLFYDEKSFFEVLQPLYGGKSIDVIRDEVYTSEQQATDEYSAGDPAKSIETIKEMTARFLNDPMSRPRVPQVLSKMAQFELERDRRKQWQMLCYVSMQMAHEIDDANPQLEAEVVDRVGKMDFEQGDVEKGMAEIKQAEALYSKYYGPFAQQPLETAAILRKLLRIANRRDEADQLRSETLAQATKAGPAAQSLALYEFAVELLKCGDLNGAEKAQVLSDLSKSIDLFRTVPDYNRSELMIRALQCESGYRLLGRPEDALVIANRLLEDYKSTNPKGGPELGPILTRIGLDEIALSENTKGLAHLRDGVDACMKFQTNPTETISSLANLADCESKLGVDPLSDFLAEVRYSRETFGDVYPQTFTSLVRLGDVYAAQGKSSQAVETYNQAIKVGQQLPSVDQAAINKMKLYLAQDHGSGQNAASQPAT